MGKGNILSMSTLAGGGTLSQVCGGYPIPGVGGGYPILGLGRGYPVSGLGGGYPIPGLKGWGYPGYPPGQVWMEGGTPSQVWGVLWVPSSQVWMVGGYPGYPLVRSGWGTPPPIRQSSIASTCYTAGGMPVAFTQEDFLVVTKS